MILPALTTDSFALFCLDVGLKLEQLRLPSQTPDLLYYVERDRISFYLVTMTGWF